MQPVIDPSTAVSQLMAEIHGPIVDELAAVEDVLQSELKSQHDCVNEMVRHGARLAGKRLRPALLLLAGKSVGPISRDHIVLGAVVEMIHTATLAHDDVLDGAQTRRHQPTMNSGWGNHASVLFGDYLFTHSFYLASTLESTKACQIIGRATNVTCEGELRQIASSGNFDLGEEEYLGIIGSKTAELCACCCRLGALSSQADPETIEALAAYGHDLGMAFQIKDDLLDLLGDERTTGKSLGTDLDQGKMTLPLIWLRDQCDEAQRRQLAEDLKRPAAQRSRSLLDWLESSGALDHAQRQVAEISQRARQRLRALPGNQALDTLDHLLDFIVLRSH
jgi:octaprenyl-diphosphate synthase